MSLPTLILAAGFGTRMQPLTLDRPKALIEVAGRPLLEHALAPARQVAAAPLAVNGHYRSDAVARYLATHAPEVAFLDEQPEILDSGGAVKAARAVLGEGAMATLNADAVWAGPNPLASLIAAWDPERHGALLLLVEPERAVGRVGGGDFAMDPEGRLSPDARGLIYTGAQILGPRLGLDVAQDVFSMWRIWDALLAEGRLYGLRYAGRWADVGHPGGIALAEEMLPAEGAGQDV